MDLAAAAAELYALPPGEFIAARKDKAKAAKAAGDAEAARQIGRLPKPNAAAWAVNMLVRHRPGEIAAALELGESFRRAQEEGDAQALRDLGGQRHRVLADVVRSGRDLAGELGNALSDAAATELEQTLRAAISDPAAAAAVRSGLLVRGLFTSGLEPVDLSGAVAVPVGADVDAPAQVRSRAAPREAAEDRKAAEERKAEEERRRREQVQADLDDAELGLRQAEADVSDAEQQLREAESRRGEISAELERLKDRIEDLEREKTAAVKDIRYAERSRELARRLADQERRAVQRAREQLEKLG
jgi:hypothetical protein